MKTGKKVLFLKCSLVVAATGVLIATLAATYSSRVHGPSLVVIPVILVIMARASYEALKLAWLSDGKAEVWEREPFVHGARWLNFWAWLAPMVGMMGTVLGIWLVLTAGGASTTTIHDRLLNGGGVVFAGTFVGILAAVMITSLHRLLEDALDW